MARGPSVELLSSVVRVSKACNRAKYFAIGTMKFTPPMLLLTLHEIMQNMVHEHRKPVAVCLRPVVTEMWASLISLYLKLARLP
jgi:hypothetical protein